MQSFRFISRYCKEYFFPSCSSTSGSHQPEFMQHPAIPLFFGFGCPGCSCLIENIPVSNLWLQAVGRQCSFCRRLHSDFYCIVVTGVRRRVRRVCWRPGLFVVSQHVWSPQWLVSPTCLRWHVCGKPACLEPASARFSDMFAMSNGSLKRDWRELTARGQN